MCINMFLINRISLCFQLVFPFRATVMWIWTYDPRNRNVAKSDREKKYISSCFSTTKVFHKMHIMNINLATFTLSVIFLSDKHFEIREADFPQSKESLVNDEYLCLCLSFYCYPVWISVCRRPENTREMDSGKKVVRRR